MDGGILDGEFRGIAPECPHAHCALGGNPKGIGLFAIIKLAALSMAFAVTDVDDPARRLDTVGILPCAFADRHEVYLSEEVTKLHQ